ncbi:hypothetical protein SAMN05444392_101897 [Seinonella peptonophila]|uniref:Uncharacterized protein n=1 Tax=Seinonella peptonophila TaxID=112248 RepID=A0A1M4UAB7_9BACL|nr:hypothetical protein [Seinonella peptonophila]SHE53679.1 hypothetical protein SAMN05444392_101897 [Seinonella peptonophila]
MSDRKFLKVVMGILLLGLVGLEEVFFEVGAVIFGVIQSLVIVAAIVVAYCLGRTK